ncbi:hypothetical protein COS91_02345 [Candidatus Desantisbacteria bacterium CG07_land_8_20_14_0_80_39_15]|uniref:Uncharacterized protein n=1 Tax=Candidatus Desantisbacteria bacterium CG07_land_8_20_14_0_80_39_15 TaxID=1974549 RepID=A0A2M6ZHG9_9BACT|nr:MAG: hypothetical protein COS91_02345 [Candidatus Desantisbacteria bacterium CG07_land_8_20_14_0_80_39_15]
MNMRQEFRQLKRYYQENEFGKIFKHKLGIYFLKMRSISRVELLRRFAKELSIKVDEIKAKNDELFEFMFCKNIENDRIDEFIKQIYAIERKERVKNENYLYSQLYKLKVFDWGGFYQNAVERTIVDNYVKKIQDYEQLCNSIENDINPRLQGYILCSWYNHWTSILIEDMFKDYPSLLPAVGLIKKVDFFWKDFPFDLKVTHFPDGFMQLKRSELELSPELTELKRFARENNIPYDRNANNKEIFSELLTRISEDTSKEAKEFIREFHRLRKKIILNTIKNPTELIKWFYEEQGVRRFDAANRFFLVLVDLENLEDSWKLKRNKKLLHEKVNECLDNNRSMDFEKLKISFNWQDRTYTTYATTLFILK